MEFSKNQIDIILYYIQQIKKNLNINEINKNIGNKSFEAGKGFDDYQNICRLLLSDGSLYKERDRLRVGSIIEKSWFLECLASGYSSAWRIQDILSDNKQSPKKFNSEFLSKIGLRGEEALVEFLKDNLHPELHESIRHVSLEDDTLGYDIQSPSIENNDNKIYLEVKTTVKEGEFFQFYLSKNEFFTSQEIERWFLVFMETKNNVTSLVGHLPIDNFENLLPYNLCDEITWATVKIKVDKANIEPGIP